MSRKNDDDRLEVDRGRSALVLSPTSLTMSQITFQLCNICLFGGEQSQTHFSSPPLLRTHVLVTVQSYKSRVPLSQL